MIHLFYGCVHTERLVAAEGVNVDGKQEEP